MRRSGQTDKITRACKKCIFNNESITKSSKNWSPVKTIDDGYPTFQVHKEAGDGHVNDELVARGSQRSMSDNEKQ
jgi:hypothetical protein